MAIDYTKRPTPAAGDNGGVSLSKVTLTKAAPSISLTKQGVTGGMLRVNLNWNAQPQGGGFFRRSAGIDLDLGCLYEFTDGSKGVVQALGNAFNAWAPGAGQPSIWLDGDDRSGNNAAGENLYVNLDHAQWMRRVLIFAYIYDGVPNWAAANGVATLFPVGGPEITVQLDEPRAGAGMCAIALLTPSEGDRTVHREVRYINGDQADLDRAYGWGMHWTAGSK